MNCIEPLALDGGPQAVVNSISNWPITSDAIRDSVLTALQNGSWGGYEGAHSENLKSALQDKFQCRHTMLTCSGTMAVELALRGVGVKAGDEVVLAAYDFPGNFRAIEAIGARPVLVDVCRGGWSIDTSEIETAISESTTAIVVSHLHGQLVDIQQIRETHTTDLPIVEDCCQVPGAAIDGLPCGIFGDVCVLSFGGSKLLSAGRGGAVLSENESVIRRAEHFGSRGNDAFPLSQLQAAALTPQVAELDQYNRVRSDAVDMLLSALEQSCSGFVRLPRNEPSSAWYKFPLMLDDVHDRELALARLKGEGVPADIGFRGFAKRTARRCRKVGLLPNAIRAASQTILLHHPVLLEPTETLLQVAKGIAKVAKSMDG